MCHQTKYEYGMEFTGHGSYPCKGKNLVKIMLKYTAEVSKIWSSVQNTHQKPSSIKLCFIFNAFFNAAQACSAFAKIMEFWAFAGTFHMTVALSYILQFFTFFSVLVMGIFSAWNIWDTERTYKIVYAGEGLGFFWILGRLWKAEPNLRTKNSFMSFQHFC